MIRYIFAFPVFPIAYFWLAIHVVAFIETWSAGLALTLPVHAAIVAAAAYAIGKSNK